MKLKPQPGIFLTLAGMACTAYAGWGQVKEDLSRQGGYQAPPQSDWQTTQSGNQSVAQQQQAAQQAYAQQVAAAQQGHAGVQAVAAPRVVPPDPFAPKPPTFSQ